MPHVRRSGRSERGPPPTVTGRRGVRLFIAINLPEDVRRDVWDAAETLRLEPAPVRWVAEEAIHLTLKFLGDVADAGESSVRRAVDEAVEGTKPFMLNVGGFGVFPPHGRPNVVWVGCERSPALEILQHRIESTLAAVGYPLEVRTFSPHLTLGRVKRGGDIGDVKSLKSVVEELEFQTETFVDRLELMESTLGAGGPRYSVRHSARFAA